MASVGVLLAERIQDRAYKYDVQHFCVLHRANRNTELCMHIPIFRGYILLYKITLSLNKFEVFSL